MTVPTAIQLLFAASLISSSALAQTRYCISGDLDHLSRLQKDTCRAKAQAVRTVVATLNAPDDWHFVVVCGEDGWKDYAAYATGERQAFAESATSTNLEEHETFLRESLLDPGDSTSFQNVVAHEVAAIKLHTRDEVAIRQMVQHMLPQTNAGSGL